jgi:RNA polymerase sigma-70 factor (ECF subfamily)
MNDDAEVIQSILAGDPESFRILVQRYEAALCRLVRNLTHDLTDWEDVAQDVFVSAYQHLARFDSRRASFATWLFTIARNKCFNAMKRRRPQLVRDLPERADCRTPDLCLSEKEWFDQLDAALDALPFEQQTVFVLAEIHELPLEEIGQIEGVPLGTVKSRLSRAKEKLRASFRPTVEQP